MAIKANNLDDFVNQVDAKVDKDDSPTFDLIPHEYGDPFDQENPRSLCNLVPPRLRQAILNPDLPRQYLGMAETTMMRSLEPHLEIRDHKIRIVFWDEYNAAVRETRKMYLDRALVKVCNSSYFYKHFMTNKYKMAFLLNPPSSYKTTMRELLHYSLGKMRDIITLPISDRKGGPNIPLIREMIKIFAIADARVQGAVKQTIDLNQKSLSVSMQMTKATTRGNMRDSDVDSIDAEIQALEKSLADTTDIPAAASKHKFVIPKTIEAIHTQITDEESEGDEGVSYDEDEKL